MVEYYTPSCGKNTSFIFQAFNNSEVALHVQEISSYCIYTILGSSRSSEIYITKLEATQRANVTFIGGVNKHSPLFSFNNDTAPSWNAVTLRGPYNSFYFSGANTITVGIVYDNYNAYNSASTSLRGIVYPDSYGNTHVSVYPHGVLSEILLPPNTEKIEFICRQLKIAASGGAVTVNGIP